MEATSAIVLLLVLSGAVAGPVGSDMCSTRCPDSVKFTYKAGWSYEYQYKAETRTTMAGAAEDTATVTIGATAKIEVLEQCEMALLLTDVVIKRSHEENSKRMVDADKMSGAKSALESRPLRFAFHDGSVTSLCPDDREELWTLNIKRGILSALQNSMRQMEREEHVQEADVTGKCPTHYKVTQQGWKSLTVTKTKDMLACTDRHDAQTSLLSVPYNVPNSLQSLPLLKSSHECTQDVEKEAAIVQRSSCHEVHVFRPFSKANNGAVTEASQTLTFRTKAPGIRSHKGQISRRTSLVYEHKQGVNEGTSNFKDVKNKLKEICETTKVDIRPQVPHMFAELVHSMRSLDHSDLQNLDKQLEQNRICQDSAQKTRKFFQDALPMVATEASLRMMADLLTSEEIKDSQATFWLTSLAFLSNPTKEMISAVQPLLSSQKRQQDALLPVSSLVNNYCEQHTDCMQHEEVLQVLDTLTTVLGPDCSVSDANFKQVLVTLRAIGNIGRSEAASLRLEKCFIQSDLPMDVRVAALDAYRRMPCTADRDDVMEVFLRHSEDSELRIAAYLAVMQCPSDSVLTQVRQALLAEEVNQVGSFVWTHLTNLLETESPHKQAIRDVLGNELLQREFSKDRRKFSRNTEVSFFSDKFNLGATFESNTIWSSSSFLPRSAMVNLTVDMFGHSVNLLELGGRVQGLEYLLQTYFGADSTSNEGGYGQTNAVKTAKLVRTKANYGKVKDDLRGQLYMRVFGNELAYGVLDGSGIRKLREGKAQSFFDDLAKKLMKDGQVSFTQSAVFLDTTIIIPTVAGLPLNLTINGSASLELQASQKMDFKKINAKSKAFEVAAMLQPSGAVEVASAMSVDAFVTQVGLKMTSRLHTSTAVKGRVELARGQILSVEINTPRDTMEIFDFQSKFFIVHDTYEKEQQMIMANRKEKTACTGQALAKVVGMELCASLSFPNASTALSAPYFPFTGPTSVALVLRKHDVHSGYRLLAKQIQTSSSMITQVSLDTPGSKVDRAISLGYVLNHKAKTLEADLLSPWKKVSAKMSVDASKKRYEADAAVTIDSDKEYKVHAQVDKDIRTNKEIVAKVKPTLEVTSSDGQLMSVKASMDYKQNKMIKSSLVVEMKDVLKKPITVDYTLGIRGRVGKMKYKNNLKLSSQFATVKSSLQALVGSFTAQKRSSLLTVRSRMDYQLHFWPSIKRNILNLGLKLNDRSTPALRKYGVNMNFDSKQSPEANLQVNGEVSHKKTLTKLEVKVRHGQNIKLKANKDKELVIAGMVAHKIADPQAVVTFDLKAIYPEKNLEYQLKGKHEHSKRSVEDYLTLRYAKGKGVDAHLKLSQIKKKRSATFDLSYPAGENYPARNVKLNADLTEKSSDHHVLSALASLQKGEKHSLVVSYKQPTKSSVEISSEVNIHKRPPIKLDVSGNYALRNMQGEGRLTMEGETYRLMYTSDIQKEKYANFTLTFIHPQRRIQALLEGGRDTQEAVKRARAEVLWDADRDPSQKAGITMEMADKANPDDLNFGGMVEVFTPLKEYQHVKCELRLENSRRRIQTVAETVLGDRSRKYSAKFMLSKPVTWRRFKTQAWVKIPNPEVRHVEVKVDHSFEDWGKLSTVLKGTFNQQSVQMGVSGSKSGDLMVRELEGAAFFKSTMLPGARNFRLTFNHRDTNGHYNSQSMLDANGDRYTVTMEADFQKVHYQINTNGEITILAPQLTTPVKVGWKHKNSLHDVTSSVTVDYPSNKQVHLEVDGKVNIVTKVYEAQAKLRGPWKDNGAEHVSRLDVNFATIQSGYDLSTNLQLDKDSYRFHDKRKQTNSGMETTTSLEMSRFPQHSFELTSSLKHSDFPYALSLELKLAKKTLLNLDVEVENPKTDKYRTSSRMVFAFEDIKQDIAVSTRHDKNRRGQWITKGDVEYEVGKKVAFTSVVDVEKDRKMIKLDIDTPFDEARDIRLEYSHSGNAKDMTASCSLTVTPLFDTISTSVSWSNKDQFKGNLRVDTPFKELRYMEVRSESRKEGDKRRALLAVEFSPKQKYKLETTYNCHFPSDLDLMVNITTPHKELPSLHSHLGYQHSDSEVTGIVKLITPAIPYDELSVSFRQQQSPKSFSSQVDTVIGSWNAWTSRTDVSWDNEIDGLFSVENNGEGRNKVHLLLSHKGHTWEDFRTKASFKMNGDRLESEVAYSNKDGRSGLFMLATPDPDIDFFKTTFFQRLTEDKFEARYTVQYGEASKPYDLGLMTVYSDDMIAFSTDLKTPHTKDLGIEIGFARKRRVELKLFGMYGPRDKINFIVNYNIRKELWKVGGEFEYMVGGSGRNIGFLFKRDGPLDNLKCSCTTKYMGKEVTVDVHYTDGEKKTGTLNIRSNFKDYTNLAAAFNHSGNSENFQNTIYLKYKDDKEAKGSVSFQRNKWKRVVTTVTLNLPYEEFRENKLTLRHVNRKNKVSTEGTLKLGSAAPINGKLDFVDDSKLTVSVKGPYKDFESFTATGNYDDADKSLEGDAVIRLASHPQAITVTYMVRAGIWPVMTNIKAKTPFEGWENVELTNTHDGVLTDFTSSYSLTAPAVGTVESEVVWTYTSPSDLDGLWTLSSSVDSAENLKLAVKNAQSGKEYTSRLIVGWELLKEIILDTTVQLPDSDSSNRYRGSLALTSPLPEVSQLSVSFDHSHDDRLIQDSAVVHFNDKKYLDADFRYDVGDRRVGTVEFREPRPMEFKIGGRYTEHTMTGELMLNWDKLDPAMNIHLTGDYTDHTDHLGTDSSMKVWVIHPVRIMGMEYLVKKAAKEFQSDFLLTWNKSAGQTLSYIINWTDRSSRFSSAYDAVVKVGVPMRSVQVEGMYSNTGRVRAAEGSIMWDADRDKSMKLGAKGQLDKRGNTNKVELGLDLPFVGKEYSLSTEAAVNSGKTVLDARTEFSYSVDPRKLIVVTTRIDDISYGRDSTNYSLALGVVHPITDLDVHMTSHVGQSRARTSAGTSMVYMTADREKKMVELRGEIDKLKRIMGLEFRSPVKNWALEGQLSGDTEYNLQLVSKEDGQKSRVTDIYVNPETRTFELTFFHDKAAPSNSVKLFGHMVNDQLLQTEVYRMAGGQRVSETLMTLRLNSSHVLHTRLNWRPSMLRDLQQYLGTQLTVFSHGTGGAIRSVVEAMGREVEAKYKAIMEEIKEEAKPLLEHLQREMGALQADLDAAQTSLRRFYLTNTLHVQDMSAATNEIIKSVLGGMQGLVLQFQQLQIKMQQDMAQFVQRMGKYPMAQRYAQLAADFANGLKNSRVVLEEALDKLSVQLARFSDLTYRRYLIISRQIDRKLQGYTAALRQSPQYQGLSQMYGSAQSGLRKLSGSNYRQLADAANLKMLEALEQLGLKEAYLAVVTRTKQFVGDQFHDIVQRPEFQQIYVIGNEIYQQGVWAYHYWHVEKNTHRAVGHLLELAKDIALLEITRVKNAVVDLDKSRVIVFDPQNGELQFEIYLPVALKSFSEPPDLQVTKYVNRIRSWAATYIPSPRHSLWTTINNYLPNMDTDTWLPPFTANAYVMGDQHLVTFDRKHYSFAGRCSYILARDMADDRFTVILKYNNRPRQPQVQSIIILLRGVAIEVDRDNKVKVNNQERELPFFSGIISATRQQSLIRVQDGQALSVEIDSARGIYSVALSGWYHGRTAGLLGTYDNEPFNDLMDSQHRITGDVEAFTNSWEVGRRFCRSRNLADPEELDPEAEEVQACRKFLSHSSSYFSPCFGQLNATEVVNVCVGYVKSGLSIEEAKCKAGQNYRYMCGRLGIKIGTPAECVSCQLPGMTVLGAGDEQLVEGQDEDDGLRSADVVFVVEESACNAWAQQSLASIATQLSQAMTTQGLKANRFGLVSYSGNGSQDLQLVHTIEGQVFGQPDNFLKATENLRLTYTSRPGNAEAALRKAVQYPFRVGVAKLLVLLPCSSCTDNLFAVGQVLTSHGFKLHVLNSQDLSVTTSPNSSPVRVFGVDSKQAYTQRSAARRQKEIFQALDKPRGACARVAFSTNGSVFDAGHMQARNRIQKEFLKAFASQGAVSAVPPKCEICSCHDDGSGRGHTVCRSCNVNSWVWNHIPNWLQSSSTSVMGVFNELHHQIITSLDAPEAVQVA
ncbi:uncharacterized protein LOC143279842 [Babylonia areolata]|uniref:uncharacterized protein LOC143279842 n=1 Tax=Babylonia areolata TaxID=304850 RepID=UPI003FD66621